MSSHRDNPNPPKKKVNLPEPDQDNITVLTNKLPKGPILPWNRYDSPWHDAQGRNKKDAVKEEEAQVEPGSEREDGGTPGEKHKGKTIPFKRHQG
ncbi:hypothetical protein PJF56_11750 [Roseofilum sp. BLCC_M91]|uniref:Uncharacterized protein n=1 Tax=Roseofilum halophilum BLCC-M91 TaxID=3022259 RepID=A0ABT7BK16_9CYAN|nr:hypothetical protein [Roseofilum halophilum]MDJ1179538.1 hypothetical protein [Roseofilum halophilum BLCC-M91]